MFPAQLKWAVSAYSKAQPPGLSFGSPELSELAQVLISKKNVSHSIEMSCFSLLQSSASRSQFWPFWALRTSPQPDKPRNTKKWPASINNRTVLSFSNSTDRKGTRLLDGPKLTLPNLARQYVLQSRNLTKQSTLKKTSFNKQSLQFCPSLNAH